MFRQILDAFERRADAMLSGSAAGVGHPFARRSVPPVARHTQVPRAAALAR
jgi:hypothetical protein